MVTENTCDHKYLWNQTIAQSSLTSESITTVRSCSSTPTTPRGLPGVLTNNATSSKHQRSPTGPSSSSYHPRRVLIEPTNPTVLISIIMLSSLQQRSPVLRWRRRWRYVGEGAGSLERRHRLRSSPERVNDLRPLTMSSSPNTSRPISRSLNSTSRTATSLRGPRHRSQPRFSSILSSPTTILRCKG